MLTEKFYAVAFKENENWKLHLISSQRGSLNVLDLGSYLRTKKDVKEWFVEQQNEHDYEEYVLCF